MTPQQRYYRKNKERLLKKSRDRYHKNIEKEHERSVKYSKLNKETIKAKRAVRLKQKRLADSLFKIRSNVYRRIRDVLKKNNSSKNGKTILSYLKYSTRDLKNHLENQFETWITWNNYGQYKKSSWDDNDSSTWTWQIDHIVQQCKLPHINMEDDNFKKCWALENLRPLSSKENFNRGLKLLKGRKL